MIVELLFTAAAVGFTCYYQEGEIREFSGSQLQGQCLVTETLENIKLQDKENPAKKKDCAVKFPVQNLAAIICKILKPTSLPR